MSQSGKLMPNLDQNSTKLLNLTVLQRTDPFVEEILFTAAHVTLYEFNIDLSQWSRKDVEGSLFVVKRNTQPRFQFIVMNRRNTENLIENLLGDFEYEIQIPYLLYRNAVQEVNGIWFYNARECEDVANLFSRILSAYSKVPAKSKMSFTNTEFEELEVVPTMDVIDGPLEPPPSTASNVKDISDDPAFINFFSSAMSMGNPSTVSTQPFQTAGVAPPQTLPPIIPPPPSAPTPPPVQSETMNINSQMTTATANLLKPSIFFAPSSSPSPSPSPMVMAPASSSTAPLAPLHPPLTLQRPYGAPLLQPFPPPTPRQSLTPPQNHGSVISRDRVREALLMLVEDNQFIDMVHRALLNSHPS